MLWISRSEKKILNVHKGVSGFFLRMTSNVYIHTVTFGPLPLVLASKRTDAGYIITKCSNLAFATRHRTLFTVHSVSTHYKKYIIQQINVKTKANSNWFCFTKLIWHYQNRWRLFFKKYPLLLCGNRCKDYA